MWGEGWWKKSVSALFQPKHAARHDASTGYDFIFLFLAGGVLFSQRMYKSIMHQSCIKGGKKDTHLAVTLLEKKRKYILILFPGVKHSMLLQFEEINKTIEI